MSGEKTGEDSGGAKDPAQREEACLDAWLARENLDAYGNAQGTIYAGGTPLFDERTGEQTPRTEYVYRKHPAAKAACASEAPQR